MEDPTPIVPVVQKRPREEDAVPQPSTPAKAISSQASTPLSVLSNVQTPSPIKLSAPSTTAPARRTGALNTSNAQQPVKKKRKVLNQQEKDEAVREKEAKAKAKADKAAQKESEAKLKADEKAQKAAQKEAESKAKADEKAKKEEEKAKREAEKREKEEDKAKKERKSIQKSAHSDYERCFLPFSLPSTAILAPANAFMDDAEKLNAARARLDQLCKGDKAGLTPLTVHTLKVSLPARAPRGLRTAFIKDVVKRVHGSPDRPIDLTTDAEISREQPLEMLNTIPMKYLHFGEDVRPPYYGTYTKYYPFTAERRLARNPVLRIRQDTNYDYDSEAEWEEPEEGEDLDSDGEDDLEEEGDDDMDGFLDDEEDPQLKRRMLSGDLEPISTGLCWEDFNGVSKLNNGFGAISTEFKDFKMEFLLEPYPQSIDPFSTAYWAPPAPVVTATTATTNKTASANGLMQPPVRLPLAQRTMNGMLNTLNPSSSPSAIASKPAAPKKLVPDDQLPAFKAEIQGKDLTKLGMIEALKKAFPKLPKAAITNTLSIVAARVGPTEKEKRWVLVNSV
ncbi:chromatin assembly factor-I (CAF-I) p90 subunit [Didymella pomorum]|uniref:Chromatin assembly factor-I (CAF-I) p90 subunit n=1 Tax=Didymella pomorum TaxID=749634 RepID=A0A9W8ZBD4_9PLEO|nr:chromatin assembly factor-I (CAF-I) p90 subunit [Didymella pomorum]